MCLSGYCIDMFRPTICTSISSHQHSRGRIFASASSAVQSDRHVLLHNHLFDSHNETSYRLGWIELTKDLARVSNTQPQARQSMRAAQRTCVGSARGMPFMTSCSVLPSRPRCIPRTSRLVHVQARYAKRVGKSAHIIEAIRTPASSHQFGISLSLPILGRTAKKEEVAAAVGSHNSHPCTFQASVHQSQRPSPYAPNFSKHTPSRLHFSTASA